MRNDYIAMLGLREERPHHKEGGSVSRGKELAHMNKQEMRDYGAMLGIKDETSKHRRLAEEGRGGDTRIGEMSHGAARRMDQEIHHGHKRVNPRTGLREYMLPLHQYQQQQQQRPSQIQHSGKIQKGNDCAAHAALAHIKEAFERGNYTPKRYQKIVSKPSLFNLFASKSTIARYINELNSNPNVRKEYSELSKNPDIPLKTREIMTEHLNKKIDRNNANFKEYLTKDGFKYDQFIPSDYSDKTTGKKFSDMEGRLKNAQDYIRRGHGISVATAGKPDIFYYNYGENKPVTGSHIMNIAKAYSYSDNEKSHPEHQEKLKQIGIQEPEEIIGEVEIHDSNHFRPTRGYVMRDGMTYAQDYTEAAKEKMQKNGWVPPFQKLYDLFTNRNWYDIDYSSRQRSEKNQKI